MLNDAEEKELGKLHSKCRTMYVTQKDITRVNELRRKADLPLTAEQLKKIKEYYHA